MYLDIPVNLGSYELRTCCKKTLLDIIGCIKGQKELDILSVHSKSVRSAPLMLMLLVFFFFFPRDSGARFVC